LNLKHFAEQLEHALAELNRERALRLPDPQKVERLQTRVRGLCGRIRKIVGEVEGEAAR
jgi:hypothetical protein